MQRASLCAASFFTIKREEFDGTDRCRKAIASAPLCISGAFEQLKQTLRDRPQSRKVICLQAIELAHILNISVSKASQLKDNLHRNADTPYEELYERNAITPIPFTNPLYPDQLHILIDPPAVLYAKGDHTLLTKQFKIAIIGSRKATVYSKKAMSLIVPPLVENEAVIVSGLAKGADTMAHEAALEYGGKTIAVLGHGLFHLYPKENRALAEKIAQNHLLDYRISTICKPGTLDISDAQSYYKRIVRCSRCHRICR